MTLQLGQSSVIPRHPLDPNQSITKKISDYIFRFDDKIGQGNFSKVFKGYHQITNQQVAIKIIELSSLKSPKLQQLLFSQIQVIQSLNHPNILKCYEVLKSQNNCYIITELCNGGDLQTLLKKQGRLNQHSAATYIRDIFKGLLYLGQRGIVHRDLKIANIFLHNGIAKIADFGFAKYTNNQNFKDLDIGSPLYMSPQGMIDHIYGMKTDIWSFGVIIYELFHGKTPFCHCRTQMQLKSTVLKQLSYNIFDPSLPLQIRQLIMNCMTVSIQARPLAIDLVKNSYLSMLLKNDPNNANFQRKNVLAPNSLSPKGQQMNKRTEQISHKSAINYFPSPNNHKSFNQRDYHQTKTQHVHQYDTRSQHNDYSSNQNRGKYLSNQQISLSQNYHQVNNPYMYNNQNVDKGVQKKGMQLLQNGRKRVDGDYRQGQRSSPSKSMKLNSSYKYASYNSINYSNSGMNNSVNTQPRKKYNNNMNLNNKYQGDVNNKYQGYVNYNGQQQMSKKLQSSASIDHLMGHSKNKSQHKNNYQYLNQQPNHQQQNYQQPNYQQQHLNHNQQKNNMQNDEFSSPMGRFLKLNKQDFILSPDQLQRKLQNNGNKNQGNHLKINLQTKFNNSSNVNVFISPNNNNHNDKNIIANITLGQNDKDQQQSNCSWSPQNVKKKFPKVLSYNQVNQQTKIHSNINKNDKYITRSINKEGSDISANQYQKQDFMTNSIPSKKVDIKNDMMGMGFSNNNVGLSFYNQKSMNGSGMKKFGEMIKKDKKIDDQVIKSSKKININGRGGQFKNQYNYSSNNTMINHMDIQNLNKTDANKINSSLNKNDYQLEKTKAKSQIYYYQPIKQQQTNLSKNSPSKKQLKQSNQQLDQIVTIEQTRKQSNGQIVKNIRNFPNCKGQQNIILTVLQFKQAIAILHYCRLFFRFILCYKKLQSYDINQSNPSFDKTILKDQYIDKYCHYLLTVLTELIQNIQSKQIIYDGQNYKKKQIKEDKLKQVTKQYYQKYFLEINKNKSQQFKIYPTNSKTFPITKHQQIVKFFQDYWKMLDNSFQKVQQINNQNFRKFYVNLCYFAIRIVQANKLISKCLRIKKYDPLSSALIQNWLSREYFDKNTYFSIKQEQFGKINTKQQCQNNMKGSQTNDTDCNFRNQVM